MKKHRIKRDYDEDTVVKYCTDLMSSAYTELGIRSNKKFNISFKDELKDHIWVFDTASAFARSLFEGSLYTEDSWKQCYDLMDEMYEVLFEGKNIFEETGE